MPTVAASIRFSANFSTISLVPLRVSKPGLPPVIGIVRASLPLTRTAIWSVCRLAFMTTELPILKSTWRSIWP